MWEYVFNGTFSLQLDNTYHYYLADIIYTILIQ